MLHRKLTGFLLGILVVGLSTVAWAGVPDLDLSTAMTGAPAGVSVFNLPNGQGVADDGGQAGERHGRGRHDHVDSR